LSNGEHILPSRVERSGGPRSWTDVGARYVQPGLEAIARRCRTAIASHHRYCRAQPAGIRLYWHEGFRRPGLASPQRLRKRRGPFAPNFGDTLSPLVVSLLTGRRVVYANDAAKLVALGSIFFALQDGDEVWGAGLARREHVAYAASARGVTYRAVRGPATARLLRTHGIACSVPFGDPAILLPLLIENDIEQEHEIAIVPHWSQFHDFEREIRDPRVKLVDVCDSFAAVARAILSCRLVVSTSLHGVILAESYGIPALLVFYGKYPRCDATKYIDYFESTDRDLHAGSIARASDITRLADRTSQVPTPRFSREALLAAFPYPVRPLLPTPTVRWSQTRRHMLGCFQAGDHDGD
jgi:pyruvyltransferase